MFFCFVIFFVLCQFSFTHGIFTFYIVFWAWILVSLQVNDVLVWGLSIFLKVVMLLGLGVWKMMVVVVDMVTHNSLSLVGLDASPTFNDAIVI
jgi:hypothetical protein